MNSELTLLKQALVDRRVRGQTGIGVRRGYEGGVIHATPAPADYADPDVREFRESDASSH